MSDGDPLDVLDENGVIEWYLRSVPESPQNGPISLLDSLLRDGDVAMNNGALWLGASAFLIAIEQLGKTITDQAAAPRDNSSEQGFRGALTDFGPRHLQDNVAGALYALRCSLVHGYSFVNLKPGTDKHHVFVMRPVGPLVKLPETPWDGTIAGQANLAMKTLVNVVALRDLTRSCVQMARQMHAERRLTLVSSMSIADVLAERLMQVF